ncbi:hypothetical protein GCM10022416_04850 [Actinomadura keratinilytica]|uniref:Uncharacterized protein n=1 Tax=Actinomadura keratinilytica TaxID=547461 RepID=A0ABP7Y1D3_9ACTN
MSVASVLVTAGRGRVFARAAKTFSFCEHFSLRRTFAWRAADASAGRAGAGERGADVAEERR